MSKKTESDFLHPVPLQTLENTKCDQCTNREERKRHEIEGYCNVIDFDDNLPIRCVGDWGKDKITFLRKYVDIVAKAMKNQFIVNYIEICSGPGRCVDNHSYELIDGSPLTILTCDNAKYISNFLFVDFDKKTIDILNQRINMSKRIKQEVKDKSKIIIGDYTKPNELVTKIKKIIPQTYQTLNIIFIDPTNFEVPFNLYHEIINKLNRVDFIINFPFGMDLNRNICNAIKNPNGLSYSKYKKAIPYPNKLNTQEYKNLAFKNGNYDLVNFIKKDILLEFKLQGYKFSSSYKIKHYYELIFFSKSNKGLEFWKDASKIPCNDIENRQSYLF
ncbi:MAG: three-Cys-motif partner protein TcmP [Bacteroidales bacterium]|nr:three-Cys-motif partner protein TcmP [Bacteroidales bacterium]